MVPLRIFLVLCALVYAAFAQGNCGAPQCYSPCTDARPQVDIVFVIDVSGSMQPKIQGVTSGLNSFVSGLTTQSINPAFAVVLFGDSTYPDGRLSFALSTNANNFKTYMTNLGNTYPSGGIEPGLEALNQALNKANSGNLNIAYRTSANSKKVFILVTDEDSDMARSYTANLFSPQSYTTYSNDKSCYNPTYNLPGSSWKSLNSVWNQGWQAEIDSVAKSLIDTDSSLYMFVGGQASLQAQAIAFFQTCNTIYQYCNPNPGIQVQNPDYSGFNLTSTLTNLQNNQSANSLQGKLLAKGKTARCFDVRDTVSANSQTLMNNFFGQIVADLSACNTKCFTYECLTASTCKPPIAKCDCNGVPFTEGGTAVLDKNGICCPANKIDLNNVCCTGTVDSCNICSNNPGGSYTCLQDCAGVYYLSTVASPNKRDECNNCIPRSQTRAATCVADCKGNYYTQGNTPPYFTDNCGYCVIAGTNPNARKDDCGVCDGGNRNKGPCGNCFETTAKDRCDQFVCLNLNCSTDCDGVARNPLIKHIDKCGNCVLNSIVDDPNCVKDCANVYFNNLTATSSPNYIDNCGNCVLRTATNKPVCIQDCNGVWGGTAYRDNCTQCVVNNIPAHPCLADCAGQFYRDTVDTPVHTFDDCGECTTTATKNRLKDNCGVCTNTPGYVSATQCTRDCKGTYSLITSPDRAFVDSCGDCWFATQRNMTNYYMDDCGVCFESRDDPAWNKLSTGKDTQGKVCKCTTLPIPCPGGLATTCTDDCPPACLNGTYDECGICPGQDGYKTSLDSCQVCISVNHTANSDRDSCGICFGENKSKLTNPCRLCDASKCFLDCLGTPLGTAVYDVCGVCGGDNTTCSVCGDTRISGSETCDLGADNGKEGSGCTSTCQTVSSNNAGALAGGIIGALAGIVVLGLAAFFALQYAKKNGLIGSANKSVDMGASNTNPLFKSETQAFSNPLYSTH